MDDQPQLALDEQQWVAMPRAMARDADAMRTGAQPNGQSGEAVAALAALSAAAQAASVPPPASVPPAAPRSAFHIPPLMSIPAAPLAACGSASTESETGISSRGVPVSRDPEAPMASPRREGPRSSRRAPRVLTAAPGAANSSRSPAGSAGGYGLVRREGGAPASPISGRAGGHDVPRLPPPRPPRLNIPAAGLHAAPEDGPQSSEAAVSSRRAQFEALSSRGAHVSRDPEAPVSTPRREAPLSSRRAPLLRQVPKEGPTQYLDGRDSKPSALESAGVDDAAAECAAPSAGSPPETFVL